MRVIGLNDGRAVIADETSIHGSDAEPWFIDHEKPAAPGGYAGLQLGHKSGGIASPQHYRLHVWRFVRDTLEQIEAGPKR
jgi:hypothetical protein